MDDVTEKRFYKTSEVAGILNIPATTLRYWESEFPRLSPRRTRSGQRLYTPADIRKVEMINYLLKEKGLKIEAAKAYLKDNPTGHTKEAEVVMRLRDIKNALESLLGSL
jgi:probable transcriptional regulator